MLLSVIVNLGMLAWFKYGNFLLENFNALVAPLGVQWESRHYDIVLPVGISFYTFVTMSYVIDVYRRETPATRDLLDFAVFVAFFPHLVAGPILRASNLLAQIDAPRSITREQMRDGAWLIVWGYFQKVFVADNLAGLANAAFDPSAPHTGINILLGVYAFAFQIYGDFAGYSNIARGTSKLMGIELIENFRFPYLVRTPQAFWRNWHISLSTWLRDYLYIPLGGSRGSEWQTQRNLFITMVLGGLWHGAAWTFVFWGIYHGVLLIAYRSAEAWDWFRRLATGPHPVARAVSWAVMFHITCYGWLIFRARSAGQIRDMTASLVGNFAPATVNVHGLLVPLLLCTTPLLAVHACEAWFDDGLIVPRLPVGVRYSIYVAAGYLTLLFGNFGGAEFIYFQF
jgi:D-alanyl-lipoteichoic acid acyltransferase DltB (MBOAT superfamily)